MPRLGLTYSLGSEGKTLLKYNYAMYADSLPPGTVGIGRGGTQDAELYYMIDLQNQLDAAMEAPPPTTVGGALRWLREVGASA